MGAQRFDTQTDFSSWTNVNCDITTTPGWVTPAAGYQEGTLTSPVMHATPFVGGYGLLSMGGNIGQGCVARVTFRSATTSVGAASATWLPWMDTWTNGTSAAADLDTAYTNAGLTPGEYYQVQLYVRNE